MDESPFTPVSALPPPAGARTEGLFHPHDKGGANLHPIFEHLAKMDAARTARLQKAKVTALGGTIALDFGDDSYLGQPDPRLATDEQLASVPWNDKEKPLALANRKMPEGTRVGVRLNLNLLGRTGGKHAIQSIHDKSWGGKVVAYDGAVTLKNPKFNVSQAARSHIAAGRAHKSPMASVDGELSHKPHSLEGVEVRFNPKTSHLFNRADNGWAVKSADEATIHGHRAYVRGNIEYWHPSDAPAPLEGIASDVQYKEGGGIVKSQGMSSDDPGSIVAFHGGTVKNRFSPRHRGKWTDGAGTGYESGARAGYWFSSNPHVAHSYADEVGGDVSKWKINFKNPMHHPGHEGFVPTSPHFDEILKEAKAKGHDGIIFHDVDDGIGGGESADTYLALHHDQAERLPYEYTPQETDWSGGDAYNKVVKAFRLDIPQRGNRPKPATTPTPVPAPASHWGKPTMLQTQAFHAQVDQLKSSHPAPWHEHLLDSLKGAYESGDWHGARELHDQISGLSRSGGGVPPGGTVPSEWAHTSHHAYNHLLQHTPIPPVTQDARDALHVHEKRLITSMHPHEELIAVGHDGHVHKLLTDHHPSQVDMTPHWDELRNIPHGAILSHNHPGGWHFHHAGCHEEGQSFSDSDLGSACGIGAREMHVVTPKWRFTMTPGAMGSRFSPQMWQSLQPTIHHIDRQLTEERKKKVMAGDITWRDANTWHQDDLWRMLASRTGLHYTKSEHGHAPSAETRRAMRAKWGRVVPDHDHFA
jgi:hypothetical protein